MAAHSSILAWRIPRTEQPEGWSPWVRIVAATDVTAHTPLGAFRPLEVTFVRKDDL